MNILMQVCTTPVITAYGAATNLVTEYTAQVCISVAQHSYLDAVSSTFFKAMIALQGVLS